jgi:hypothetical protein
LLKQLDLRSALEDDNHETLTVIQVHDNQIKIPWEWKWQGNHQPAGNDAATQEAQRCARTSFGPSCWNNWAAEVPWRIMRFSHRSPGMIPALSMKTGNESWNESKHE